MVEEKCKNKEELKLRMHKKINETIDTLDKIGKTNFFEVSLKHMNGDINVRFSITDIEKAPKS